MVWPPQTHRDVRDEVDALRGHSHASAAHADTHGSGGTDPVTPAAIGAVATTALGSANGVATLGADARIPSGQLPPVAITDTFVVASQAAMLALTAEVGDVAVRSDLNRSFILRVAGAGALENWQELLTPTDQVLSVNGYTGAVVLTAADVDAVTVGTAQTVTGEKKFTDLEITNLTPADEFSTHQGTSLLFTGSRWDGSASVPMNGELRSGYHAGFGFDMLHTDQVIRAPFLYEDDFRVYSPINPPPDPPNMVTTDTAQTISGAKTVSADLTIDPAGPPPDGVNTWETYSRELRFHSQRWDWNGTEEAVVDDVRAISANGWGGLEYNGSLDLIGPDGELYVYRRSKLHGIEMPIPPSSPPTGPQQSCNISFYSRSDTDVTLSGSLELSWTGRMEADCPFGADELYDAGNRVYSAGNPQPAPAMFGLRNRLVNGDFRLSQRNYFPPAALAVGAYGYDRWKAGTTSPISAATGSTAGRVLTLAAGGVIRQDVESVNMPTGIYVLSHAGTAHARIYTLDQTPPAFAAGPLVFNHTDSIQTVVVELQAHGGTTRTVSKVQLEQVSATGTTADATPFEVRPIGMELDLARRYYQRVPGENASQAMTPAGVCISSTTIIVPWILAAPMRAAPTVSGSGGSGYDGSTTPPVTAYSTNNSSATGVTLVVTCSGGALVVGRSGYVIGGSTGDHLAFAAEM